jgi:hypothetical protein
MSTKNFKSDVQLEGAVKLPNKTANRALITNGSGELAESSVTDTELGHLSGVTSDVQTQIDGKADKVATPTQNRALTSDASGHPVESGVTIDGSNNVTIPGDLTVNGTTTTINTTNLDVTDKNITVNNGGDDVSSEGAGLTVERTGVDGSLIYADASATKFKIGAVGSEVDVVDVSSTQTFTNKSIDGTSATGTNSVTTDADQVTYERVDGSKKNIQAASDELEAATSDLDDAIGALAPTPTNYSPSNAAIVADHLSAIDTALATAGNDEQVKVSANDTTTGYLEDKIIASIGLNPSNAIEVSVPTDGIDEDLQIQFDESKVVHDNLSGFVANEHVDHSTVSINTNADSGLAGGGDITTSRSLSVDINGTTAETAIADADEVLIYDSSAGALRKMTKANFVSGLSVGSAGDIAETSSSFLDNQPTAQPVTNLSFANGVVRSFKAQVTVIRGATFEVFELMGVQKSASWDMSIESVGDDCGVTFSISITGQVQYTSTSTGAGGTIKFRAETLSV